MPHLNSQILCGVFNKQYFSEKLFTLETKYLIFHVNLQCETSNLYGSGVAKFAKVTVIGRTTVRIGSGGSDPEKEIVVHAGEKLKIPCRLVNRLFAK